MIPRVEIILQAYSEIIVQDDALAVPLSYPWHKWLASRKKGKDMDRQHRNETVVPQFGRRLGAASGLLSIALLSVGNDVLGGNSAGILVELFGFAFFLFFLGSLWACLRNAEGAGGWLSATAFGAGVAVFAVKVGGGAPLLATMANKGMDPEIARALIAINDASFLIFLPLAVMLSATAVVAIRWGALPRWLGWMAAVTALALLVGLAAGVIDPYAQWAVLPMLLYALWVVATSIVLIRRAGEPHSMKEDARLGETASAQSVH
jgi:hypothetical protein